MRSRWMVPALSLALLVGCAQQPVSRAPVYSSGGYGWGTPQPAARGSYAQVGQVTRIERVDGAGGAPSGGGAVIGGVAGAVVGRQLGNSSSGRNVGTLLGAVGGALIGNEIERGRGRPGVIRVTVQFDNGGAQAFDYAELGDLRVGDRVRLQDGQLYRY